MGEIADRIRPPLVVFAVVSGLFLAGRLDVEAWERFALFYLGVEGAVGGVSVWRRSVERVERERAAAYVARGEPDHEGRPRPCR